MRRRGECRWLLLVVACVGCTDLKRDGGGPAMPPASMDAEDASMFGDASRTDAAPDAAGPDCERGQLRDLHRDRDGDGYGSGAAVAACAGDPRFAAASGDCDDDLGSVHPGAPELCNGVDDDCDPDTVDGLSSCNGFVCDGIACAASCDGDEGCVSTLRCIEGSCQGTLDLGTTCAADLYCESNACECASAACDEKRCATARCDDCRFVDAQGAACTGLVDGVEHGACGGESVCHAGACKVELDGSCAQDAECITASCSPAQACQTPGDLDAACDSAADCAPDGSVCAGGQCKLQDGTACSGDDQCASGSCFVSCRAPASTGELCDSNPDCSGSICGAASRCVLADGQTCTADAQCNSGSCNAAGTCQAPVGAAGACDSAPDCQAGLSCSNGACRWPNGHACGSDDQCVSRACKPNDICEAPGSINDACDSARDCAATMTCSYEYNRGSRLGSNLGVCKRAEGEACSSHLECPGEAGCYTVCSGKSDGFECFSGAECSSDFQCWLDASSPVGYCDF